MNSVVLWYDIGRQGATNESMSLSPILKDLSGNGNDATCYNFGWSGMSGIGGYSFTGLHSDTANECTYELTGDKSKITILTAKGAETIFTFMKSIAVGDAYHYKVKVTGLDVFKQSFPNAYIQDGQAKQITADGVYDVSGTATYTYVYPALITGQDIAEGTAINITIEQLPLYPNALVSDGVNDYAFVQDKYDDEGNLINKKSLVLNREDGYTVIAKRKWLDETLTCGVISKIDNANDTNGAFGFELSDARTAKIISNWGSNNPITLEKNDITYGTSTKYNSININSGTRQIDTDYISIFKFAKDTKFYGQFALYSFILFNRDLTDEEIEWVKNNLIQ